MATDSNIILQGKPIQLNDPLEVMGKAMSLKQMSMQNQAMQREQADKNSYIEILKRNTSVGADGKLSINKGATLSELSKTNPTEAMSLQQRWASENIEDVKKRTILSKQLAWSMTPQNYGEVRSQAIQLGIPHADKLPEFYDPSIVRKLQLSTLEADEQLKQFNSDRDFNLKKDTAGLEAQKTKAEIRKINSESGSGPAGSVKMTEAQSKSLGFGRRAMIADQMLNKIMSDPKADVTSLKTQITSSLPKWMGDFKNPQEQALKIAKLGFIASVLRKESGAAVTPEEFNTYDVMYFPQPGDAQESLADKQVLRANFIDTEKMTAGNAWRDPIQGKGSAASAKPTMKTFKTNEIDWAD